MGPADLVGRVRPDAIVHLAAIAVPFSAPDAEMYATNTGLFFSVRDAALEVGVSTLLVASSPTVIGYGAPQGWTPRYLPLDEAHSCEPWNGYVMSKLAMEALVREPVGEMLTRLHPEWAEPAQGLVATASVFSSDRARVDLGWQARRSWRTEFVSEAAAMTDSASR